MSQVWAWDTNKGLFCSAKLRASPAAAPARRAQSTRLPTGAHRMRHHRAAAPAQPRSSRGCSARNKYYSGPPWRHGRKCPRVARAHAPQPNQRGEGRCSELCASIESSPTLLAVPARSPAALQECCHREPGSPPGFLFLVLTYINEPFFSVMGRERLKSGPN